MRVAFCLRGAVSKKNYGHSYKKREIYRPGEYIDLNVCYESIKKHIFDVNPDVQFDVFIHCWNVDLQSTLIDLYHPVAYLFEDNNPYINTCLAQYMKCWDDFGGLSQALTMKKVIELMQAYQEKQGVVYDRVILYRPDLKLWKDMRLADYHVDDDVVYTNDYPGGDFHFVMTPSNADAFKGLLESAGNGNPQRVHCWIDNYIVNYMHKRVVRDAIRMAYDQEVLRKIKN